MLLVYSEFNSPRLSYILKFILGTLLGYSYKITTNKQEYINFEGAKLNYSSESNLNGIWICPSNLLLSNKIENFKPEIIESNWGKIIFPISTNSKIPFDIFSASFYLLSRYEEYLPFTPDEHNRFSPEQSISYKADFLNKPIINIWAKKLFEIINLTYPNLTFNKSTFKFISTIDIDNAFAYKAKGFYRSIGGFTKSILKGKIKDASDRIKVITNKLHDHYDNYDFIREIHLKYNISPKVFILSGKYGKFDKNVKLSNLFFIKKIKELASFCEIGIHPSYKSNNNDCLQNEIQNLESIIEKKITISRQHFLMLNLPKTYRKLIELGIKEDYSMGYSNIIGYRAGTCSQFNFYDLLLEKETELNIYPFAFMERTLRQHLKLTPDEAKKIFSKNIEELKNLDGMFVSLWHNESLGDAGYWKGWKSVYEYIFSITK